MKRRLVWWLVPVVAEGLLALLPITVGSAASAAESDRRPVSVHLGSDAPATLHVADEPRLAQRLGTTKQAADSAAPASGGAINARSAGAVAATGRSRTAARPAYESNDVQGLRTKWYRQVEYPLQLGSIDRQITLAQARVESYQKRLQLYARYNAWAPPQSGSFSPSQILPRPPEYYPQTAAMPVQAFSPPSTFSHVLGDVTRKYEEAKTELDSLVKRRDRLVASGPDGLLPATRSLAVASDYDQRLVALAAERKLAEFKHDSLGARVQQFDRLSQLTYSVSYADLREKLVLGRLEAKLQLDGLDEERQLLQAHLSDWQQLQKAGQ